jgi:hypothetical protein
MVNCSSWTIHIENLTNITVAKVFHEDGINGRALLLLKKKHFRKMKVKLGNYSISDYR